ncbi:MAG: hypothetical protein COA37_17915 [Hoeflea sp.]|uniref:hypothetical protein n=1 Tax=Hoeflea sp. TaxID=1940281 RepID=UPI000C0E0F92|nr:hypothetical protein [Hoeflea sp.]PHR19306.1 MAG: hypothetical protein COA37_17915 [Hoeflea sp.]
MTDGIRANLSDDGTKVSLEFLPASGVQGTLHLTADQLLKLNQQLGSLRAQMVKNDTVPELEGQQIEAIINPKWHLQPGLIGEASMLCFQHPAFGPLGFAVPVDQVQKMVQLLSNHVALAAKSRETPQ